MTEESQYFRGILHFVQNDKNAKSQILIKAEQSATSNQTSLSLVFSGILCMGLVSKIKDFDTLNQSAVSNRTTSLTCTLGHPSDRFH